METPYILNSYELNDLVFSDDAVNDHAIIFDLSRKVSDIISLAMKYRNESALAYDGDDTLTKVIDCLDDLQFNVIRPHQDHIDLALREDS
jgi:hypothetical protein|tara:strand:- start:425 stop:694 length:270 start_codon:yes stop_codon:yes gene_type:complete